MRRGWMLPLGLVVIGWLVADRVISTLTLEDRVTRPVTGLSRTVDERTERLRLAVEEDFFGAQAAGTVRVAEETAMLLGTTTRYRLPGGGIVRCGHVLRWMWCDGGWVPERAE